MNAAAPTIPPVVALITNAVRAADSQTAIRTLRIPVLMMPGGGLKSNRFQGKALTSARERAS